MVKIQEVNVQKERNKKRKRVSENEKKILKISQKQFKNKDQRRRLYKYQKYIKKKMKKEKRIDQENDPKHNPKGDGAITIEMKRTYDPSMITEDNVGEIKEDEMFDEFESYFSAEEKPKVLITTGHRGFLQKDREPASKEVIKFVKDMLQVIPNSNFFERKHYKIKEIIDFAINRKFTFVIVISDKAGIPYNMIMSHLPEGPTISFRISSYKHSMKIKGRAKFNDYFPELILKNFQTRLGLRVGRMLQALFPQKPEFTGRRVCTFHNQRDFIFFRHHRYQFENKKDCTIQEIGPKFTLRVMTVQLGTFDPKFAEYEWYYNGFFDKNKRTFFL